MAAVPSSLRMMSSLKTSATSPRPRCEMRMSSLLDTMPADSCPRCCSASKPRYTRFVASGCPKTPTIPHSSRKRSCITDPPDPEPSGECHTLPALKPVEHRAPITEHRREPLDDHVLICGRWSVFQPVCVQSP